MINSKKELNIGAINNQGINMPLPEKYITCFCGIRLIYFRFFKIIMEVIGSIIDFLIERNTWMDKKELIRLLDRSKNGSISKREATKLDNWYISFEDLDDYIEGMWLKEQDTLRRSMLSTIQKEIHVTVNSSKIFKGNSRNEISGLRESRSTCNK